MGRCGGVVVVRWEVRALRRVLNGVVVRCGG